MFELIKNNPRLNNVDSFFDRFFNDSIYNYSNYMSNLHYNYSSDEDNYYIELALPGLEKKDINIHINDNYLCLDYESKEDRNSSFYQQSFNKRIKLPTDINIDNISAHLKNGILSITIQRIKKESNIKQITIK